MNSKSASAYLNWIAYAVLVIGILLGLIILSAPAGIWLGLWAFPVGLNILIQTDPYTHWVLILCILGWIKLLGLALRAKAHNTVKLCSIAAAGVLSALIAWYIPSTFQARLTYPVIHDVSTDVVNPPAYVAIAPLRADVPNSMVYGTVEGLTPAEHAEQQLAAFPDLVPRLIDASPQEVWDRALAALQEMDLEIVAAVPGEGRIEAIDTTFWFRFKDDVVIRIQPQGGQTLIDARSLSRVGRGDAGTNGLRLQRFFELL